MSDYSKHFWATGEVITASKLNNIENQLEQITPPATNSVRFDEPQQLTDEEKAQARQNIDVAAEQGLAFDGGYVDNNNYIHFTMDGIDVDGFVPFVLPAGGGGGGGGGGGNNAIISLSNSSGWASKSISSGTSCSIQFTWSSLEDNVPTGNGSMTLQVDNVTKAIVNVAQGTVNFDVTSFLILGANKIKVSVSDVYDNTRSIVYNVTVVELSISSSFDSSISYEAAQQIQFAYTPVGAVKKTVYITLDDNEPIAVETTSSGRQMTQVFQGMRHGKHSIFAYCEATIGGETVSSNELYYEFAVISPLSNDPIITSAFRQTTVSQYTTLNIPYQVYTPNALTSAVLLYVNNRQVASLTIDRSPQTWVYRPDTVGTTTLTIATGEVSRTFTLTVTESTIDIEPEEDSLVLHLSSIGRNNAEEHPEVWNYNTIHATLSNFNFVSDGWVQDSEGITALRVSGDARVSIPYKPFAQDFRTTGKTIEIEFASSQVMDYDAVIMSCVNGGRGFTITAQKASMSSEQSNIFTQYKENEHVRIAFVVEKRSENRLLYIYINGIMSGVIQYPVDDDFSQPTPANITIGSSDCAIDIYNIRIYDNDLTRYQILNNWMADTQNLDTLIDRYERNNIYNEYSEIVIDQLPRDLPYLVLKGSELPQYKGDKKTMEGDYVDPNDYSRNFNFTGAQVDVQGTSSQYYARKNYKIKFKNGFVMNGQTVSTYPIRTGEIPVNTFTFKADVASSEGANNVELARLYNDTCPYKTPAQIEDPRVRQGMDGFPSVIFWDNGLETTFVGKYNFNNDKGTEETFGFVTGDESWEVKNNTSSRVLWKSNDYTGDDWLNDFEARYPEDYTDPAKLKEFADWIVTTDTTTATNAALPSAKTYEGVTYTTDSAAYRLAKFRDELHTYVEVNSAIYYYLFTELFLMVDSRAKNMFPSFMGSVETFET